MSDMRRTRARAFRTGRLARLDRACAELNVVLLWFAGGLALSFVLLSLAEPDMRMQALQGMRMEVVDH